MTNNHQWYENTVEYRMYTARFEFRVYVSDYDDDDLPCEWGGLSYWIKTDGIIEFLEGCESAEEAQRLIVERTLRLVNIWREELEGVLAAGWETVKDD